MTVIRQEKTTDDASTDRSGADEATADACDGYISSSTGRANTASPRDAGTAAPSVILNAVRFTAAAVPGSPAATAAERAGTSDIATGVINATGRLKSEMCIRDSS